MSQSYCTHIDLIRYGNTARLLSQLASPDYGAIPSAEAVLDYFLNGISAPETEGGLRAIKSRVEQAIKGGAGEINGYLALFKTSGHAVTLPSETLTTANMDLALARLFTTLADDSVIKTNAAKWSTLFDKIATGKIPMNSGDTTDTGDTTADSTASAETVQTTAMVWTEGALDGY